MTEAGYRARSRAPAQQRRPSLLKTGTAAEMSRVSEAQRQEDRRNRRNLPWRLWVPWQGSEEDRTRDVVILDSSIDECPVFYEHALPDPNNDGKRTDFQLCIKEQEHCPLCERHGDSHYVQMLSVIEVFKQPVTTRDGRTISHSKRLLPLKWSSQPWFRTMCRDTMKGNMRGTYVILTRENNERSPSIGTPRHFDEDVEMGDGSIVKRIVRYDEDQIIQSFGHPEVRNQQGQLVKQANSDCYPYDYEDLFPTPTAEELRRRYGGIVPAGSREEVERTWGAAPDLVQPSQVGPAQTGPAQTGPAQSLPPTRQPTTTEGPRYQSPQAHQAATRQPTQPPQRPAGPPRRQAAQSQQPYSPLPDPDDEVIV